MLHMIGHALLGLVIGVVAKLLMPGSDPGGWIVTALLGIAGGWAGGAIGRALGWYQEGQPAGFGLSVVGAMALLLIYRLAFT
ncbi:MAG TPA: GlsB/YeaQ/YmgE family stress response membrane protein [Vicinamibacterales bacterium]